VDKPMFEQNPVLAAPRHDNGAGNRVRARGMEQVNLSYELFISGFGSCGMIQLINARGERVCI
jgi:hypothetical protein